MVIQPSVTALA